MMSLLSQFSRSLRPHASTCTRSFNYFSAAATETSSTTTASTDAASTSSGGNKSGPNPNGVSTGYTLEFGKHKGQLLENVDSDYRKWLILRGAQQGKPALEEALKLLGHDTSVAPQPTFNYNYNGGYNNNGYSRGGYNNNNNFYNNGQSSYANENVRAGFTCNSCGARQQVDVNVGQINTMARQQRQQRFGNTSGGSYGGGNNNFGNKGGFNNNGPPPSKEPIWQSLKANPAAWKDCRFNKPSEKYPDFKSLADGQGLWINGKSTPEWAKAEDWGSIFKGVQ